MIADPTLVQPFLLACQGRLGTLPPPRALGSLRCGRCLRLGGGGFRRRSGRVSRGRTQWLILTGLCLRLCVCTRLFKVARGIGIELAGRPGCRGRSRRFGCGRLDRWLSFASGEGKQCGAFCLDRPVSGTGVSDAGRVNPRRRFPLLRNRHQRPSGWHERLTGGFADAAALQSEPGRSRPPQPRAVRKP